MTERIIRNSIRCRRCGDEIVSEHRHDFRRCSCGAVAVDGGQTWLRRLAVDVSLIDDTSIVAEDGNDDLARQHQQAILVDFSAPAERLQRHFGDAAVDARFDALEEDAGIAEMLRPAHRRARSLLQIVDEQGVDDDLAEAVAAVRRSLAEMEAWSR